MQSVLVQDPETCPHCGRPKQQEHHVLFGRGIRQLAEEDGFKIPVCEEYHRICHSDRAEQLYWKRQAQRKWEETRSRESFIARYGKSYL